MSEAPDDLLSLKDAAKLIPSPYGGNRGIHVNTMKRWVLSGRVRHWKIGPFILVSKADVLAMPKLVVPVENVPTSTKTDDILRRHGLLR